MSKADQFKTWLDERFKLSSLKYPIPETANSIGYTLGALTLFAAIIMGVTGTILAQFYNPTPDGANASVAFISSNWFLAFVRNLHWWTAVFIPLLLYLHMTRIVVTGSYKKPREGTWFIGLFLLLTALGSFYTGTVLKWDQEGFEALLHSEELAKYFGVFGLPLTPEFTSSTSLLSRIYAVHVSLLPAIGLILIGIHLLLIKLHGITALPSDEDTWKKTTEKTFIDHMKVATIYSTIFFIILSVLAIIFPRTANPAPITGIEVSRPPWAFLPIFPLENYFGLFALVIFPSILFAFFFLIPFIDRDENRDPRTGKQKFIVISMLTILTLILLLNILSAVLPPGQHI